MPLPSWQAESADERIDAMERFPRPFEVAIPPECDGWEDLYASHALFAADRRAFGEGRFWFHDAIHAPEALYPFDAVAAEYAVVALNQASSRLFVVPTSLGVEYRILNGYMYVSANDVTDESITASRGAHFEKRGGYYYEHWDELYARWLEKVAAATGELEALQVPSLPEMEEEAVVLEGGGVGSSHLLLVAYNRLLEGLDRIFQYHFELLNLGYGAYLAFYELCRGAQPEIADETIAQMVVGGDLLVLRPDDELKRLAGLAVEVGVAEAVKSAEDEEGLRKALAASEAGARWLADFEATKNPWFYFSYGTGVFYHHHRSWIDDPRLPIATIGRYVERLEAGETIARSSAAAIAERDAAAREFRSRLAEDVRQSFDESLVLAEKVYAYVENHNFLIDHRYMTLFWNKVREFGALLAEHGFLVDGEDVFYLRHDEARAALEQLRLAWSSGRRLAARPRILAAARRTPQVDVRRDAALGAPISSRAGSGGDHRSDHDHAVGDHDGAGPGVARSRPWRECRARGDRRLAGRCRGAGACRSPGGRPRPARGRRDPGRGDELDQLDTGVREGRRGSARRRRHHVPRRDRRPRVRSAGRGRDRNGDEADQYR